MKLLGIILGFAGLHILWGRKASFPYAVGLNLNWYSIFFLGYLMDCSILLLLYWSYDRTFNQRLLSLAKERVLSFQEKFSRSRMISWAKPMGKTSLFLMPVIPTAGRPFIPLFLTLSFKLNYRESFRLFALGNFVGTALWLLIMEGFITRAKVLTLLRLS